ncbi:MAG TPA: signal peptidase II [Candidatus Marinimicrobia bacterium]|jgi:signal peptidase II|nr:signal peptidase II [Candidatus Neomarinimicrobiota bacterium]HIO88662.1 signal peptidase II [Candidatus Neomarinimicrobiota bacterium]
MNVLAWSGLVLILDQLTKQVIRNNLELHDSIQVIGKNILITYVENPGIAFGINIEGGSLLFMIASLLATALIFLYLWRWRNGTLLIRISLALILGGAFGNLTDRFLYGKVVDFIQVGVAGWYWPIFNVADSAVTIGMILFLYLSFFRQNKDAPELA